MIHLHHLAESRSQRIIWLLEELEAPYEIIAYARDPQTRAAPAAMKRIHPLGKSPILCDDDIVVAESGLIAEYLCERFPDKALAPNRHLGLRNPDRLRWAYWLHYAEGSAMTPLLLQLLVGRIEDPAVAPLNSGFIARELNTHADYWESELGGTGWFAGPFLSAADIMMAFPIEAAERFDMLIDRPNCGNFLTQVRSREAYRRARKIAEKEQV